MVVLAMGCINGSLEQVRAHWPKDRPMPATLLNGAHPYADGKLHQLVASLGGQITRAGQMWNYAAGFAHPFPHFPGHGLSTIPCKLALWLAGSGAAQCAKACRRWPLAMARPEAAQGNRPFLTLMPWALASHTATSETSLVFTDLALWVSCGGAVQRPHVSQVALGPLWGVGGNGLDFESNGASVFSRSLLLIERQTSP